MLQSIGAETFISDTETSDRPVLFKIRVKTPEKWKAVLSSISRIVEEATFEVSPSEVVFRAMDISRVSLLDFTWPSTGFEFYECDRPTKIGVKVDELLKLIKRAEPTDSVEMSLEDGQLQIRFIGKYKREYRLHLIEAESALTTLPRISFNASILMDSGTFERILNDIGVVSDYVLIKAEEALTFSGKSEFGDAKIELESDDPSILEMNMREPSESLYSLEHLLKVTKNLTDLSSTVRLEFSSRMPIKLSFVDESSKIRIGYYLAPRIE